MSSTVAVAGPISFYWKTDKIGLKLSLMGNRHHYLGLIITAKVSKWKDGKW